MHLFRNRPFALGCILFVGISLFFARTQIWTSILLGALGLLTAIILLLIHLKKRRQFLVVAICICVCVLISSISSLLAFDLPTFQLSAYDEQEVEVEGVIHDILNVGKSKTEYKVKLTSADGKRINSFVSFSTEEAFSVGNRFAATATITAYEADNFAIHANDYAERIYGSITVEEDATPLSPSHNPIYLAKKLNQGISRFFQNHFSDEASSLMSAMLIGDRTSLSLIASYQFRRAGVSHLLALSGLHVSILCMAITKLCELFRIHRRPASIIVIVFVVLYAILAGLAPSIVRATIMTAIVMLGVLLMREHDSITSLFFAAALIALFSPSALLDLGYWMSVFATLGILLVEQIEDHLKRRKIRNTHPEDVEEDPKKPHPVRRFVYYQLVLPILFTMSATICTLPFSCFIFGQVSILFLVTNLIFPTLMSFFLYVALISIPLWFLRPVTNLFAIGYLKLMGFFANIPETLVPLTAPYVKVALALLLTAIVLFFVLKLEKKKVWIISIAVLSCVFCFTIGIFHISIRNDTSVQYVSTYGSNDYLVLHNNGKTVLCGATSSTYYTLRTPVTHILSLGENEIDILYLPHFHANMADTLHQLTGHILIREIYVHTPASNYEEEAYALLSSACKDYGIRISFVDDSHKILCEEMVITTLPRFISVNGEEHGNAALRADIGGESILYFSAGYTTSDAFTPHVFPFDTSAEILIFGCHGTAAQRKIPPNYPLTAQTHTILLTCEDTGIALSDEEYKLFLNMCVERGANHWVKEYP